MVYETRMQHDRRIKTTLRLYSSALEELVIDAEIAKTVFRLAQGIEVNDNTLALDVSRKVGLRGNFLAEKHTLDYFRMEHILPDLSDRRPWLKDGAKGIVKRAKKRSKRCLRNIGLDLLKKTFNRKSKRL